MPSDPDMTPLRALNDACRALCGERAMHIGRHDDACLALREVFVDSIVGPGVLDRGCTYGGADA